MCKIGPIGSSNWLSQYWNAINPSQTKKQVLNYCKKSVRKAVEETFSEKPVRPTGSQVKPGSYCRRVGNILRQFKFVEKLSEQQDSKVTLFGVGLVAYCGACECCNMLSVSASTTPSVDSDNTGI